MGFLDSIASTGNQLISNFYNTQATSGEREHQYQMTDYLYSKDLEQWNRENEYNSPAAQQQRILDAGLNPHLMYGQGTVGNAGSFQSKATSGPTNRMSPMRVDMPDFVDLKMKNAQVDAIKAMAKKTEEETKLKVMEQSLKALELGFKPAQIDYMLKKFGFEGKQWEQKEKMWPIDLQGAEIRNQKLGAEIINKLAQTAKTEAEREWLQINIDKYKDQGIIIGKDPWYIRMWSDFINQFGGEYTGEEGSWSPGPATVPK